MLKHATAALCEVEDLTSSSSVSWITAECAFERRVRERGVVRV